MYTHRSQGEDVSRAISVQGRPYTELPTAFRYRQEFNPSCSCKRPGETWMEATGGAEDTTLARGDIVVTEENSKTIGLAKPEPAKKGQAEGRSRSARAAPAPAAPPPEEPSDDPATSSEVSSVPQTDRPRTVGPQFYPVR